MAKLTEKLKPIIEEYGLEAVRNHLLKDEKSKRCRLIADNVVHRVPADLIQGKEFVFAKESLAINSTEQLLDSLRPNILRLLDFLRSENWHTIRLIYTGHAFLPSIIKHLTYRVTHKETEDIIYFGDKGYLTIEPFLSSLVRNK